MSKQNTYKLLTYESYMYKHLTLWKQMAYVKLTSVTLQYLKRFNCVQTNVLWLV